MEKTDLTMIKKARHLHAEVARVRAKADAAIEKRFGDDVFARFGTRALDRRAIECVPTGFPHLDDLLSGWDENGVTVPGSGAGIPCGKIVEIAGKEGAFKTTLALHLVKAFQQRGHRALFLDHEAAVDLDYARRIGVVVDSPRLFRFSQPGSAEEGLNILDDVVKKKAAKLVVVDSVAALTPQDELDGDMGDAHVGLQARLVSQALRKTKGLIEQGGVCVVMINQLRVKIGGFSRFGPPPEQTTGGNALRYYSDIRLDMRVVRQLKKGTKTIGAMSRIRCLKNKVAPPFRDAYVEGRFGRGIVDVHPTEEVGKDDEDAE